MFGNTEYVYFPVKKISMKMKREKDMNIHGNMKILYYYLWELDDMTK